MSDILPVIILIEPQLAENVGMAARAMMNCGLCELRLVNPRENHLSDKAISASSNAEEILFKAKVYTSTQDAIADLNFITATTARHRDQTKAVLSAEFAAKKINELSQTGIKCGILFGPERTGLNNNDVCLSDAIINIPLNPKHCSLNLSQAVLLVGYEIFKTQVSQENETLITNHSIPTTRDKVVKFCEYIEEQMSDCGNFKSEERRNKLVINLRNIFTRSQLTEQELNTLYGIINHLLRK
ncbi:MAG: RNA methyltransferase [Alphaproteobacteria bacterium]|nr:RNA methyltransferase [Alphaproteobacteria bacterium]